MAKKLDETKADKVTKTSGAAKVDDRVNDAKKTEKQKKLPVAFKILIAIVALAIVGTATALAILRPWEKKDETIKTEEAISIEKVEGIDYEQKITAADGGEFVPKVTEGQETNLEMRFSDLKCTENCDNVDRVEIGGKVLKRGEDYEVKQGSVILIIYAKVFSGMAPGEVGVIFEITEGNRIVTIGVKITVEEKKEEKTEETANNQQSANSTSGQSNSSSTSSGGSSSGSSGGSTVDPAAAAKAACEAKTGPYGLAIVHFVSASEKQDGIANLGWPDDTVATVAVFTGSGMAMKYVNGVCRPSPSTMTDAIGIGAQPYTRQQLINYGITQTSDLVQWQYADGHIERQVMSNPNQVWSW